MDGKRGQIDFETLKSDLLQLGMNLRVGFEQAKENFKSQTNRLNTPPAAAAWGSAPAAPDPVQAQLQAQLAAQQAQTLPPAVIREMRKTIKDLRRMFNRVKAANSRKYSLQQGALKIFGGAASLTAWKLMLAKAASSGLLLSIERTIQMRADVPIEGLVPVLASLWLLSVIPIAQGVAHLLNGIFFAPKPEELTLEAEPEWQAYEARAFNYQPQPISAVASTPGNPVTNEFAARTGELKTPVNAAAPVTPPDLVKQPVSVTEDPTLRLSTPEKS